LIDYYGITAILWWTFAVVVYAVFLVVALTIVGANRSAEKRHGPS
jgi:hypothetical protein